MREPGSPLRISVIGAAISANKGAASMVYGLVDGLNDAGVRVELALLTTYKNDDEFVLDRNSIPDGITVRAVNAAPAALLFAFALSLPIRLLDRFGIPLGPLLLNPLVRAVRRSDVTVDLAGIAFADSRGVALLGYNVVMSMFPYLTGRSVVKASQALGPFKGRLTRTAALFVLPRMTVICARGTHTREHLDGLGLTNVVDCADVAFLMQHGNRSSGEIPGVLDSSDDQCPIVVVLPSSVVNAYAREVGIDHVAVIAELIDELSISGVHVIVAPHSYRRNGERGRMNDGPIVEDIEARVTEQATFINRDLDPRELRAIIEYADVAVTGRFHAMVSALEVGTPPVVIGWSHKYGEVLDQFDVGTQGIAVRDLSADHVLQVVTNTLEDRVVIAAAIAEAHDQVHAAARHNIDMVLETAAGRLAS